MHVSCEAPNSERTDAVRRAAAVTGIDLVDATLIIGGVGLMVLWSIILLMR